MSILALDSEIRFARASKELLLKEEMRQIDRISRQQFTRPIYKEGSKGWENFFLNMAPGAPDAPIQRPGQRGRTIPESAFQVIPSVGMRIVSDFEREEAEIVRFVEQVCVLETSTWQKM